MKIYCKQCKTDISKEADDLFEKIIIGKVRCPNCNTSQSRFIGQSDLLLYNGLCEIIYLVLTIATIFIYDVMDNSWWYIPLFIGILALCVPLVKYISRYIYKNRFKTVPYSEQKDLDLNEKLRKEIRLSYLIFGAFAVVAIMTDSNRFELLTGQVIVMIVTFVKFYLSIKENKK